MRLHIEIDEKSGFCFGVTRAIGKAEEELADGDTLFCLGDIVHNGREVERLAAKGLVTINHRQMAAMHEAKVLLRAHGEPPSTYQLAAANCIRVIDATCPVVLHLQERIKREYDTDHGHRRQIVIFGKNGHAEVLGLVGQTDGTAIVVENLEDVARLDFGRDISLYSQTTMSLSAFHQIINYIQEHIQPQAHFNYADTICRQVANRMPHVRQFASCHDIILFVCGQKSSNGRALFNECRAVNPRSFMVDSPSEIARIGDFVSLVQGQHGMLTIGICGATSTPKWLMEQCRDQVMALFGEQ